LTGCPGYEDRSVIGHALRAGSAEPRCRGPVPAISLALSTLSVGRGRALKLTALSWSDHRTAARHRSDEPCNDHQSRCAHDVLRMSIAYLQVDGTVGGHLGRRRIGGHTQACPLEVGVEIDDCS
jgi:hypothetical protein